MIVFGRICIGEKTNKLLKCYVVALRLLVWDVSVFLLNAESDMRVIVAVRALKLLTIGRQYSQQRVPGYHELEISFYASPYFRHTVGVKESEIVFSEEFLIVYVTVAASITRVV